MVSVTDSMQVTKETSRMCEQCVQALPLIFRAPGNEAKQCSELNVGHLVAHTRFQKLFKLQLLTLVSFVMCSC